MPASTSCSSLSAALTASGEAMLELFAQVDATGKVKSWSGSPPATYLAYHVAHEAHHRALATVAIRVGGHKVPKDALMGQWYTWRKGPAA